MLHRHRLFGAARQHQASGHAHSSAAGLVRPGCSRHAYRRSRLLPKALDGRAEQTIINSVGSNTGAGAVTTEQQLSSTAQADVSSTSSTSSTKLDAAAALPHPAGTVADDDHGTAAGHQQPQPQSPWVPCWESWCVHFEQQDAHGTRLDTLAAPLAAAVAAEDYATAAALKSEMDELVAADVVATVQKQLAEALTDERYAEAAELRDKGWALLEGWWACMSSQNPRGHLLRIYPEYGRWTGKAYSPRDLGELQGWSDDEPGHMLGRSSSSGSSRRQGTGFSRRKAGSRGSAAALDAEGLAQLGTPLMEVFVRREGQGLADATVGALQESNSEQQQQPWSSQAVLLQPAGNAATGAAAGAARDIGLEAEIGELFRSAVSAAVWGKSGLAGDTAAAAAANLANSSSSSSNDTNTLSPLVRDLADDGASPFFSSTGARYELILGEGGQVLGAGTLAAPAAAASELKPWEELLNSAEPLLRTAAAAADMNGGVLCADGVLRPVQRQRQQQQQQHSTPVLQLLLEIVDGSKSVLLAARAVTPPAPTGVTGGTASSTGVTHGTAWVVADMPGGPVIVPDWSKVDHTEVQDRQARIAASLEAQRIVRDMLGAQENWWMTEFMGSWSPPPTAAAEAEQPQQQTSDSMDWQLPLQLLQQQQDLQEQQQQPYVQGNLPDQRSDMTLLETTEEDDDSWPALDAVSRAGFYPAFYQDYGPGVDAPVVQPAATAAYAGFEQQAAAAMDAGAAAAEGRFAGMSPAEIEEALETLAELKDVSEGGSRTTASSSTSTSTSSDGDHTYPRWLPPDGISSSLEQQQQHSKGSRRHTGTQAAASSSSSMNWPPSTPAAAIGAAVADSGYSAELLNTGDELERHPAAITMHSRDRFTIKPSRQISAGATAPAAGEGSSSSSSVSGATGQQSSSSSSSSSTQPRRSLYVIEVPTCVMEPEQQQQHVVSPQQQQQQDGTSNGFFSRLGHEHGPAAADSYSSIQSRGYSRIWQLAANQLLLQHACGRSSAPLPVTWRQPLADLMAARAAEVLWGAAAAAMSTMDEGDNADHSSTSSSSSLGVDENAPPLVLQLPPELVDRTLAAIAGSSEAAAAAKAAAAAAAIQVPKSPVVAAAAAAAAAGTAGIAAGMDPQEGLTYRRLRTKQHPTDHLQGLFLGAFGPHGPELLSLSRSICMDSGEELLVGLKLTGDPNVPAGEVSFRARVGRRHRRDARNIYPPQLDVTARYPGEGRVAGPNFTNPRWVEGELLVFNSSSSSSSSSTWTSGAQLGFVYSMPGEKRFLILLNRVALD